MPSLYETTAIVGEVSSSNFTTLYNSSGLSAPNTGGGAVSGNLNVGGNLTVQGTSLLQGAVTLGSTLSLPNYTFPGPDGSTDQVLVTDGSGNLYWTNVTAIPGAAYTIQADTATGGANLTLLSSSGIADPVKFAGGTNITVSRTDANTITISSSADDIPNGTAAGQVLTWNGSAWTANSTVTSLNTADRFIAELKNATPTTGLTASFRRNFGSTAYANGYATTISFQFDSDSQALASVGSIGYIYDSANPALAAYTSTDNFATRTQIANINSTNIEFNGTNLYLNVNHTGAPSSNAAIIVERGSSTDASITWDETDDRWELNNDLLATGLQGGNIQIAMAGSPDNQIYIGGDNLVINTDGSHVIQTNSPVQTTADSMTINSDNTAVDSYLYMKGTAEYLKWNNTLQRFEFSDSIYNSTGNEPPAQFERQTTTTVTSANEMPNALRLTERVTDAASNATDNGGSSIIFSRTSGASGGAEKLYGLVGARYFGTTNTAELSFQWSSDNFTETSPGVYPNTYQLLRLGSISSEFFNNSLYVNYNTPGSALVGVNTDTPAYTLDVNGDANVSGDIYISGYQVDINSPQAGQAIAFDGTKFVNTNTLTYTDAAYRTQVRADIGTAGRTATALALFNDTGATAYGQNDGSGLIIGVDSDSQAPSAFATMTGSYDAGGNHQFRFNTSTNSFATDTATSITGGNTLVFSAAHGFSANDRLLFTSNTSNGLVTGTYYYVLATGLTTTQCQVSLTQGGSAVALTNGTGLNLVFNTSVRIVQADQTDAKFAASNIVLNAANPGVAAGNAQISVERGTSGSDATLSWSETNGRWEFGQSVYSANNIAAAGNVAVNRDASNANAVVVFYKPTTGTETIQWNKDNNRFELTTDVYAPQATIGNIDIDRTNGTITTNTGNLTLDSASGTTLINDTLNVDSGTLYVDSATNRVGVVNSSPQVALHVGGTIWGTDIVALGTVLATNGNLIQFNNEAASPAGDSFLRVVNGVSAGVNSDIKWNDTTKRWQSTVDGSTYLNLPNQNLDTTDDVAFSQVTLDSTATYNTQTTITSSTTAGQPISSTIRTTQKVVITVTDNVTGHMHVLEALAFQHSGTAYLTTYGEMYTNAALATFTADVSAGNIRILATPASGNLTTFKVARVSVD